MVEKQRSGKRIAIFHFGFIYGGGGERVVLEEVQGLRRRGYQVDCYAPIVDEESCYPDFIREIGVHRTLPQPPRWAPLRDALSLLLTSILAPLLVWRFRGYDVFVGANQPGAWLAWVMAKLLRKPYVVYMNQPNRLLYPRRIDRQTGWPNKRDFDLLNFLVRLARPFVAWADRVSFAHAHAMLANGDYIAGVIEKIYCRRPIVCPAGCHPVAASELSSDPEEAYRGQLLINGVTIVKPFALITNRHDPQKRFDYVIRAMVDVLQQVPQVSLVIPGSFTAYTSEIRGLGEDLGIGDRVLFLGWVTEAELQRLYAEAAVYCYSAPEEDFGMGVIESMAKGVPVVAWNHAGPTVTVVGGVTGYLARPYDVTDYAAKMARLFKDPDLRLHMGQAGHRHIAEDFTWERHITVLGEAIEEALLQQAEARKLPCYSAVWEKRILIERLADIAIKEAQSRDNLSQAASSGAMPCLKLEMGPPAWRRVLDCGVGEGAYTLSLKAHSEEVVCVDSDPRRIVQLQERFAEEKGVQIIQADMGRLPFPHCHFDLVWASEVMEHQADLSALDELERMSAKDIVITMPNPKGPYWGRDKTHRLSYTLASLEKALEERQERGWSYEVCSLGLCLPERFGLVRLRRLVWRLTEKRPQWAWTILALGRKTADPAIERARFSDQLGRSGL